MICGLNYVSLVVKDHVAEVSTPSGVIYEVATTMEDQEWQANSLSGLGTTRRMYIYHQINERGQWLYGFETLQIRQLFIDLISVDGIGSAKAVKVLSSMEPEKVLVNIADGDVDALAEANGIGRKSAEKLIFTLKPKYEKYSTKRDLGTLSLSDLRSVKALSNGEIPELMQKTREVVELATLGLLKLGYKKKDIEQVLAKQDYRQVMLSDGIDAYKNALDLNDILAKLIKIALVKLNAGGS